MQTESRTSKLYEELRQMRLDHERRVQASALEEFPRGSRVEWTQVYGPQRKAVRLRGVVERIGWCAEVRTAPGGPLQRVDLQELRVVCDVVKAAEHDAV